eukprot:gene4695-biopygen1595
MVWVGGECIKIWFGDESPKPHIDALLPSLLQHILEKFRLKDPGDPCSHSYVSVCADWPSARGSLHHDGSEILAELKRWGGYLVH